MSVFSISLMALEMNFHRAVTLYTKVLIPAECETSHFQQTAIPLNDPVHLFQALTFSVMNASCLESVSVFTFCSNARSTASGKAVPVYNNTPIFVLVPNTTLGWLTVTVSSNCLKLHGQLLDHHRSCIPIFGCWVGNMQAKRTDF